MRGRVWILALSLLALAVRPSTLLAWQAHLVTSLGPLGTVWGAEHLRLEVTAEGANLDFDCATGTISGAPEPDAQGKFTIAGTLVRERPGPTMREGNPAVPAKYSGTIQGQTLRLVVNVEGSKEPYGEYVLTRGKSGRVLKCR